jgi:hypothetical protein
MIAVQTETLVGLISGLGGAVIGAGGALVGGWLQQRWQAKTARRERLDGYSRHAGETALDALVQIQQVVFTFSRDFGHSGHDQFKAQVVDKVLHHAHVAKTAALLIVGDAELRSRLDEVLRVLIGYSALPEAEPHALTRSRCIWFLEAASEGMDILSAFMRLEPIPSSSERFREKVILLSNTLVDPS